jgi:hypothetical protein
VVCDLLLALDLLSNRLCPSKDVLVVNVILYVVYSPLEGLVELQEIYIARAGNSASTNVGHCKNITNVAFLFVHRLVQWLIPSR